MFDFELAGKVAVVTGASQGLGRVIALEFARQGAGVVVAARRKTELESVVAEIESAGGRALAVPTDVTSAEDVQALVQAADARFGRVDIAISNASTLTQNWRAGDLAATEDFFAYHLDVKFLGAMRLARAVVPIMQRGGWGRIVNVGGGAARTVGSGPSSAGSANAALANFSKGLSEMVGPDGITVNCIHPSNLYATRFEARFAEETARTGITREEAERRAAEGIPIGRMVTPEEVAAAVLFFCSAAASGITGQTISVDGGRGRGVTY